MDVLRFVAGFQEAHGGISPSFSEIGTGAYGYKPGKRSGQVHEALFDLEERGLIRRRHNRARAIEVLHPPAIPRAPDGKPLYFVKVGK